MCYFFGWGSNFRLLFPISKMSMSTSSWSIGDSTYRNALAHVLMAATSEFTSIQDIVAELPQAEVQFALMLAERMARRGGDSSQLTKDEFLAEVGDALAALREGRFHYLNDLAMRDVPCTARTLVAIRNLAHGMTSRLDNNFIEMTLPEDAVDFAGWDKFLQSFGMHEITGWERFAAGAAKFVEISATTAREVPPIFGAVLAASGVVTASPGLGILNSGLEYIREGSEIWGSLLTALGFSMSSVGGFLALVGSGGMLTRGRPAITDAGEPADIRFHELLKRAVTVMRGVEQRSKSDGDPPRYKRGLKRPNEKKYDRLITELGFKGLAPPPAHYDDALLSAHEIGDRLAADGPTDREVLDLYGEDTQFHTQVDNLLLYLLHFGGESVRRNVAEARLLLSSGRYRLRAERPLGKPTTNFPTDVDGVSREQVIGFLRDRLRMPITQDLEEEVWQLWQEAWNQDVVTATDWRMDLDDTNYEWSMNFLTGRESVQFRDVLIYNVALALKHQTPIPFASFTFAARLADYINHPLFAALRFAYTLRMPEDPDVRREEVMSMSRNATFETISGSCATHLRDFANNKTNPHEPAWDSPATRLLAYMVAKLTKSFFIRGLKDHGLLEGPRESPGPHLLVDNSRANVQAYAASGGHGAIEVPTHAPVMGEEGGGVSTAPTVLAAAKTIQESHKPLILEATSEKFPTKIEVKHREWALKNLYGFLLPILDFSGALLSALNVIRRWSKQAKAAWEQSLAAEYAKQFADVGISGVEGGKTASLDSNGDGNAGDTETMLTPDAAAAGAHEKSLGGAAHGVTVAADIRVGGGTGSPADRASPAAPPATKPNGDGSANGSTGSSGPVAMVVPIFHGGRTPIIGGAGILAGDDVNMGPQLVVHGANVMVVEPEIVVHEVTEPVRHLHVVEDQSTVDGRQSTADDDQFSPALDIAPPAVYGNVVSIRTARSFMRVGH